MKIINQLSKVISLLEDKRSIIALLTWPKFSFASYLMISRLLKQGILPKTVLDVGANVGQFTVAAHKLFPNVQVYSFEPEPKSVEKLRKNVSRLDNVRIYPIAIGDSIGKIDFHLNTYSQVSSALPLAKARREAFPDAKVYKTIKVELSTLDEALKDVELQPPVLLKLDVQGYENKAILGASETLKKVDFVLIETSFKPLYEGEAVFREILETMEKSRFKFLRPINFMASPLNGEIIEMDTLFTRVD